MNQWKGKVAVVTGACSGIGEGITEALVRNGVKVIGLDKNISPSNEIKQRLSKESGEFHAIKCDITIEEDILQAFEWIKKNFGGVDILVNNAGITANDSYLSNGQTENWRKVLDTNVLGLCMATREAVKSMKERDVPGYIIHINSVAGHLIMKIAPEQNVYTATKYAVTALAETLRLELAADKSNKIKVTSLSPGVVITNVLGSREAYIELCERLNLTPIEPKDIANGVLYLLSTPPTVHRISKTGNSAFTPGVMVRSKPGTISEICFEVPRIRK